MLSSSNAILGAGLHHDALRLDGIASPQASFDGGGGDDTFDGTSDADIAHGVQGIAVSMSAAQLVTFTSILGSTVRITTAGDLGTLGADDNYQTLAFSDLGNTLTITSLAGLHVQSITGGTGTDMINLTLTAPGIFTLGDGIENLSVHGASITAYGNGLASIVTGDDANQTLSGTPGDDTLTGGGGDDTLYGLAGNDSLDGGAGADTLVGGTGNDHYLVDRQDDVVYENAGEGTDLVTATGNYYLYANVENLTLATGAGDIFGVGNASDNMINGNEGANVLLGGAGNDTIHGNAGNDQVYGEGGNDTLYGDAGTDYLIGGDGDDVLDGGADEDALYGGDGEDTLWGGSDFKTDTMVGGAGNDVIHADSGKGDYDLLDGGADNDSYYVDTYADVTYEAAGVAAGGYDTVYANITGSGYYLYANVEKLVLLGSTVFGVGNDLDNDITGSATDNVLLGGGGADQIKGGDGNDSLYGEAGTDTLNGESGNDVVSGGDGNDTIQGYVGDDILYGDAGNDTIDGGYGHDVLSGGAGDDTLQASGANGTFYGDDGNDVIYAGGFANLVLGGAGDDIIHSGGGFDNLYGGSGDDTYYVAVEVYYDGVGFSTRHESSDIVFEDADGGNDTVYVSFLGQYNTPPTYYMTANVENLVLMNAGNAVGSASADVMTGSAGADTLMGGAGDDVLNGEAGNDTLWGEAGADHFVFEPGTGNDKVADFTAGTDKIDLSAFHLSTYADVVSMMHESGGTTTIDLGNGNAIVLQGVAQASLHEGDFILSGGSAAVVPMEQLVRADPGADMLAGIVTPYDANQTIVGTPGDDTLTGGGGDDTIYGLAGNDSIDGGAGADTLVGGAGNDHYLVDRQDDVIYENAGEGTDLVTASANYYLYANVENLTLATGAGDIFGVGNDLDNTITGNEGANVLLGGAGFDTIHGAAGGDQIYGEAGNDTLYGDAGVDYLIGGDGEDSLDGGADEDGLYGQDGNDVLWGGTDFKTDTMVGGNGDDVIHADSGKGDYDLLDGGSGNDTYYVDTYADVTYEAAGPNGGTDIVYADITGSGYYLYGNVENLVLLGTTVFGAGNDLANSITGNNSDNFLLGGDGNDLLDGGTGNDSLYGEAGNDTLWGRDGSDVISGGAGNDQIDGGTGGDTINGDDGNDTIHGGVFGGVGGSDSLLGGAGDDIIYANGNGESDTLVGGTGDDTYYIEYSTSANGPGQGVRINDFDAVYEDANGGNDTVYVFSTGDPISYFLNPNVENMFVGGSISVAVGNELANVITGSTGTDTLMGAAGDDILNGKAGSDTLWGQDGADHFVFEKGTEKDFVRDFTPGTDKIDLTAFGFSTYADVVSGMSETNGTTTIDLGHGDFVVLQGVAEASLHESDFLLGIVGSAAVAPMAQLAHAQPANDTGFAEARSALIHEFDAPHMSVVFGAL